MRYQTTTTLTPRSTSRAHVRRLVSSYTSIGMKDPVTMTVKYSAHRRRRRRPMTLGQRRAAYTKVPAPMARSWRASRDRTLAMALPI
jgi:hypothetical protein